MNPWNKIALLNLLLFVALCSGATGEEKSGRLAVLSIENAAKSHASFVASMPTMLVTELVQKTGEQLVERSKIEEAMKELGLESNGVTTDGSVKIGQWVGADRILLGSFSELEGAYRLDLRIIEVASGRILTASQATVRSDIANLIPAAVNNLAPSLAPKYRSSSEVMIHHATQPPSRPLREQGMLKIHHRITLSLFTEKAVPYQVVRVYVDKKLVGTSPVIRSINEDYVLLHANIEAGYRQIQFEHGVVNKNGEWKRSLEVQPLPLYLDIVAGRTVDVKYGMQVETARFRFENYEVR